MNKRDFYKELMSEYMFDKEKICANAKKGKLTGRRSLPIYIGMTAAVAAAVVIVGTVIFTSFGKDPNSGVQISDTGIAALSNEQRLNRVIYEIQKNKDSEERIDVFVTFSAQLSPKAAQELLLQFSEGSVPVKMLCTADGGRAIGTNEVGAVFKNNSESVTAAVISCPGYKLAAINSNELVVLAEPLSDKDSLLDLKPMGTDVKVPEMSTSVGETSKPEPAPPEEPDKNNGGSSYEPPDIDDPVGDPIGDPMGGSADEPTVPGSDPSNDPVDGPGNEPSGGQTGKDEPGVGGTSEDPAVNVPGTDVEDPSKTPSTPGEPAVTIPAVPDGVKLPYDVEKPSFITDDLGAQKAYFLSDNVFYVKSENAVSLYKWDGKRETQAARQAISDAKVVWVSENGLRLMISGVEDGVRRKLYIIDAKNCTINDMQVSEMVGEGYIAEAAYNESLDLFTLNVVDSDSRYIYMAKLAGYQPLEPQIIAFGSMSLSLMAAHDGAVYYSEVSGVTTSIFKYKNGENLDVKLLDGIYVSALNSAFTHSLVIGAEGSYIFDPAAESLIPITVENVSFGASAHSFSDGKSYFTVSAGAIVPETAISAIAKIDFMRSFSAKWLAVVSNGSVRIVPGIYTDVVRSSGVTFDAPKENASPEQRAAVNTAFGLLNALADGSCKECGIDTREKLLSLIDACFSQSEAQYIKARCEISESGELSYTSGGFTVVNLSDTVLVMESELKGTLYVKVGTFDGKTAYRTIPVTLTTENNTMKVDS